MATLIDYLNSNKPEAFTPRPFYSVEGDSLTFYFTDEPSYRERVDDFLTIYKAIGTDKLVGCQLKGVPKALKLLGDFGILIQQDSIRLNMIFIACMASTEGDSRAQYIELGRIAKETTIPAEELQAALNSR